MSPQEIGDEGLMAEHRWFEWMQGGGGLLKKMMIKVNQAEKTEEPTGGGG